MLNIRNHTQNNQKIDRKPPSILSKDSSASKLLKRKPDHKKLLEGMNTKRKRSTKNNYYFPEQTTSDKGNQVDIISSFQSEKGKYGEYKLQEKTQVNTSHDFQVKTLEKVKSQSNFCMRKKDNEILSGKVKKQSQTKIILPEENREVVSQVSNQQQFQAIHFGTNPQRHTHNPKITTPKKSKTEYFCQEQIQMSEPSRTPTQDAYEIINQKEEKMPKKKSKKLIFDSESMNKKNKWFQQHFQLLVEKEDLLQVENRHLNEIIKEKDKIIDRLMRQKTLMSQKIRSQSQIDLDSVIDKLKSQLKGEEQRIYYLKEENSFLSTELLSRSQQVIKLEQMYKCLEKSFRQYQLQMIQKVQTLKAQIQHEKAKIKNDVIQFDSYGQIQKWKQKVFSQQEQLKYLRIESQCLKVVKEDHKKKEVQNKQLKQQRDYFKKKVLENAKKMREMKQDRSLSNSSFLFELSEISIEEEV